MLIHFQSSLVVDRNMFNYQLEYLRPKIVIKQAGSYVSVWYKNRKIILVKIKSVTEVLLWIDFQIQWFIIPFNIMQYHVLKWQVLNFFI